MDCAPASARYSAILLSFDREQQSLAHTDAMPMQCQCNVDVVAHLNILHVPLYLSTYLYVYSILGTTNTSRSEISRLKN